MIEGLGLTEPGLLRIIAANAPGHLTLQDWDDNLDGYARYVAREGKVERISRAKKAVAKKSCTSKAASEHAALRRKGNPFSAVYQQQAVRPYPWAFFSTRGRHSQTVVVSSIAAVIPTTFNIAVGLATSLVALCLLAALKVGVGAYCRYYGEKKSLPDIKRTAKKRAV